MRVMRFWIMAPAVVLTVTLGVVLQRQFAQQHKSYDASATLSDKQQLTTPYVATLPTRGDSRHNSSNEQNSAYALSFDSDALEFERKLVKSAPFSATLIIETAQPAADGSSTTRTATSLIYRDSKGRTRRDRMPSQTASSVADTDQQPETTTINDPVAGFTYALEHRARLFRRTAFVSLRERDSVDLKMKRTESSGSEQTSNSQILPMPAVGGSGQGLQNAAPRASSSETKNDLLGQREIEGVTAEGTRLTITVPKGAVGNEQAMEIVVERWYSPELKTAILIKRSDRRFGESIYRLTNIKRSEPAATLFVVPSVYKITDEAAKATSNVTEH